MPYTYKCADYPGMKGCPGTFTPKSEEELWRHLELHGSVAHDDPTGPTGSGPGGVSPVRP